MRPSGTLYLFPVELTAIETHRSPDPHTQSRRWSPMALAADIADESLRAAKTEAPRF